MLKFQDGYYKMYVALWTTFRKNISKQQPAQKKYLTMQNMRLSNPKISVLRVIIYTRITLLEEVTSIYHCKF